MSTITSVTSPATTTPSTYVNPVASSSTYAGLSGTASQLGLESSIVANLGGSSSTTPLYNAVGLLNSIITAGQPGDSSTAGSNSSSTSGTGSVAGTSSSVNANWASILKANPAEAGTVAADSTIQGILAGISTTA